MKLNAFEKIAKMLAKEHKISVEDGTGWAANIKERKVFYKKNDIYNLSEDHILGLILHEIGHIHYTTDTKLPKNNPELCHATLNMLEDISIEYIIGQDYPNAGEILESTKQEVLDNLLKILPKSKVTQHEKALLYAATRFEGRGYAYGTEKYEKVGEQVFEIMKQKKDEIYNRKTTQNLMPMVEKIVELLIKEFGEPTEHEKKLIEINAQNEGNAQGNDQENQLKRKTINGLKSGRGWKEGPDTVHSSLGFIDSIADQASSIGKRLRSILKRNNAMEYGGRFRTGKLIPKRFVRIRALKDRKPFARRITKSNQSYAFAIASDVSGSMFQSYDPQSNFASFALSAMHMVGEALRLAGVPRSMVIFGYKANVVAPMGKNTITFEQLGSESALKKARTGGTEIGLAIEACINELSLIKAERKIIIILTDGSSNQSNIEDAYKKANNLNIEVLGIKIGDYGNELINVLGPQKVKIIQDTNNKQIIGTAFIEILKETIKESS